MSIEAELREEFDHWERREGVMWEFMQYLLLAVTSGITLMRPILGFGIDVNIPAALGLTVVTVIWMLGLTLNPRWQQNRPLMVGYFIGLLTLAAGLVTIAPWYGIFSFVGFVYADICLKGRWRYLGIAAAAMVMALSYAGFDVGANPEWWLRWLILSLVTVAIALMFYYFASMSERRNQKQKVALSQLHEANVNLESALEENAGLHAQLLVQAREAGVMDERHRMAREIHDTLAQSFAGVLTQLQAAEQNLDQPAPLYRHVTNATNLARDGLTEARRTVHAVEPAVLAEVRLDDAIRDVARRWSEVNDIEAELHTTGHSRPMHADVEVALLRIAQEALANVSKHAQATRVGLTLSYMEDLVTLDVRDDGIGFDPTAGRSNGSTEGGFGLAGMRQRVQRLAGRLEIESEWEGGTAISASVPAIPAGGAQ